MKIKLSTKVTLILSLTLGLGMSVLAYFSIQNQTSLALDQSINESVSTTAVRAGAITTALQQIEKEVGMLATHIVKHTTTLGSLDNMPQEVIDNDFNTFIQYKNYLSRIFLLDSQGNPLYDFKNPSFLQNEQSFEDVYDLIKHADPFLVLSDLEEGQTISDYFTYQYNNEIITEVYFIRPITLSENTTANIVFLVDINQTPFINETSSNNRFAEYIVSDSGTILATNSSIYRVDSFKVGENIYNILDDKLYSLQNNIRDTFILDGSLYSFERVVFPSLDSDYWLVIKEIPEEVILSGVYRLRDQLILSNLVLFLVVFLVVSLLTRTIVKPIESITGTVTQIARGNLTNRVEVRSNDEIGLLAKSVNAMAKDLQEMNQNLEMRVQSATAKLTNKVSELEESNARLSEIKMAIMNVMEDVELARKVSEEEKARTEAFLGSIGEGILAVDRQGNLIMANPAAIAMLGVDPSKAIGRPVSKVMNILGKDAKGNILKLAKTPIEEAVALQTNKTGEYYLLSSNGVRIPIASTVSMVVFQNKIIGAVEIMRDITQSKQIDLAKSEFVSMVSHQLRTPITTISWYIEMLMQDFDSKYSGSDKEYITEIKQATERMLDLINSLLDVSRIELGTLPITPTEINISKLAENIIKEFNYLVQEKNIILNNNFSDQIQTIRADEKLLRMIMSNLLSNALKYTPNGGTVSFDILKQSSDESKEEILIKISDTGYGIPKDQQDRVFEKMFRADNIKQLDVSGSGLGLHIVKSMVDKFNGKIWFESEVGKGSTFYVTIPLSGMEQVEGSEPIVK